MSQTLSQEGRIMKSTRVLYPVMAAVLVLGLYAAVSVRAEGEKQLQEASVKTSLREAPDDMYVEGGGPVGSVAFSTNDDGELVMEVQLNKGLEDVTFSVRVSAHTNKKQGWVAPREIGTVTTDRRGHATATFTTVAPDSNDESAIYAQLVLSGQEVSYATSEVMVRRAK